MTGYGAPQPQQRSGQQLPLFEPPIVERAVGIGKAAGTLQYAIRRKEG